MTPLTPLTPRSSTVSSPSRGEITSTPEPQDTIVRSLADWERKQELLEKHSVSPSLTTDMHVSNKTFAMNDLEHLQSKVTTQSLHIR